jgi:hypothetical protein
MDFAAAGRHNLCPAAARHSKPEGMIAGVGATPSRLKENDNQRVANAEQFSRTLLISAHCGLTATRTPEFGR